jgi:hypothetical protein
MSLSPVPGSAEDGDAARALDGHEVSAGSADDGRMSGASACMPDRWGPRANRVGQDEILDMVLAACGGQDEEPPDDEELPAWIDASPQGPDGYSRPRADSDPGFASGGALDELVPGPILATVVDATHHDGLNLLNDDELVGFMRACRRMTSRATAKELAAVAELARRRPADASDTAFGSKLAARRAAGDFGEPETQSRSADPASSLAVPARGTDAPDSGTDAGSADGASHGDPVAPGGPAGPAAADPDAPGPADLAASDTAASDLAASDTAASDTAASGMAGAADTGGPGAADREVPSAATAGGADPAGDAKDELPLVSPFASDELAAALTLTVRAAESYLELATDLADKLPGTAAALEAGVIDLARAKIIADATHVLTREHAGAVEDRVLPRAGLQTSGQLRAALARAVLAVDPDAARRRQERARQDARVMRWREDAGTAALCGRDLPSADVLAADQRITARAHELRSAGITGAMDELRARAYLDFLLGRGADAEHSGEADATPEPGSQPKAESRRDAATGPSAQPGPAANQIPAGLAARINLIVPLSTLFGLSDVPGEVAAFGPVDAETTRKLVFAAGAHPATRWCVTVVDRDGRPVGHGCATW